MEDSSDFNRMKCKKVFCSCVIFLEGVIGLYADDQDTGFLSLRYDTPASYFEEALVVGNGMMGATIYGGNRTDRISLNDMTLWTGEPDDNVIIPEVSNVVPEIRVALDNEDYREADRLQRKVQGHYSESFQPLGTLTIDYLDKKSTRVQN